MKINNVSNTSFKGGLNNKILLGALGKISDHSATFCTAVATGAAIFLRPMAISITPKVKKENKQHSIASSVSSGMTKFLMASVVSLPVENAIKNIEKNHSKYLKGIFKDFSKNKKSFDFASQVLKQSANLITAIPKSLLTISLIPILTDRIFNQKSEEKSKDIAFKGNLKETSSKLISKYFNNDAVQNFANKNADKSKNIVRNMSALTDMLLAGSFAFNVKKSKKIKSERKNNLIYNNILSTGFALGAGFGLDKLVQNKSKNFTNKFIEANKNNPELSKYLQGLNVLRPAIIFAFVYYGILPVASNFIAQKLSDKSENNK